MTARWMYVESVDLYFRCHSSTDNIHYLFNYGGWTGVTEVQKHLCKEVTYDEVSKNHNKVR
jgi:hypothetical protein